MNSKTITVILFIIFTVSAGCKKQDSAPMGLVKFIIGDADITRSGKTIKLKVNDSFMKKDIIRTGKKSIVIASLENGLADIEIQPETEFIIQDYSRTNKELLLKKGNAWLRVNKVIQAGTKFSMKTSTTVAAIRGTKIYTSHIGDMVATCVCQGKIEYLTRGKKDFNTYKKDYLLVTRDGNTIRLLPEDLSFLPEEFADHRHSLLPDSPLGARQLIMTPDMQKQFIGAIEKKFSEINK